MGKSLDELGIPASIVTNPGSGPFSGKSVITVQCGCGARASLQVSSILRTIKRVGFYRCLSCGMTAKHQDPSYASKHKSGVVASWSEERRAQQSEVSKGLWSDEDFRRRLTEASTEAWADPDKRRQASESALALWQDEQFQAERRRANADPAARQVRSDAMREVWERPEYVARQARVKASTEHVELQRQLALERFRNPEYRQHISDSLKEYWADPEVRTEMGARMVALWQDPGYLEKQARAAADPALLALKSENARRQWKSPGVRQAIVDGIRRAWEDPAYRARAAELAKKRWEEDEYRKKMAVARASILTDGRDSILERTAQTLLDTLKIPYVRHHVVGYFEFDLFIPSHNVLVECNGEYWHSLRKSQDAAKFTYIDTYFPDYRVLYLWERDFLNPNIIRHKLIRELFGELDTEDQVDFELGAVSVRQMDMAHKADRSYYSLAEEFLQSFHYAGFGRSAKVVYGAYLGDTLIGVCKFCTPVRQESATSMGLAPAQVLELDRFCIHPGYQKKNLASWLLSRGAKAAFEAHPQVSTLISFADTTFGHLGTIYKAANWQQVHVVPPDYHYVSPDGFVVHKKTLYDHASRNSRKEAEYAAEFGYVKAFGKSKIKFRLDR